MHGHLRCHDRSEESDQEGMMMDTSYCSHIGNGTYHLDRDEGQNTIGVVVQVCPGPGMFKRFLQEFSLEASNSHVKRVLALKYSD